MMPRCPAGRNAVAAVANFPVDRLKLGNSSRLVGWVTYSCPEGEHAPRSPEEARASADGARVVGADAVGQM